MGMVLWYGVRGKEAAEYDQCDRWAMQKASSELDQLCAAIGVKELTTFLDGSDLEYNMAEAIGEVRGALPTVADMNWCEAAPAITTIAALCELLLGNVELFDERMRATLLEEMTSLLPALEDAAAARQKFHLAVIM
jgi:hypothetical protein